MLRKTQKPKKRTNSRMSDWSTCGNCNNSWLTKQPWESNRRRRRRRKRMERKRVRLKQVWRDERQPHTCASCCERRVTRKMSESGAGPRDACWIIESRPLVRRGACCSILSRSARSCGVNSWCNLERSYMIHEGENMTNEKWDHDHNKTIKQHTAHRLKCA